MLPDGRTIYEAAAEPIADAYATGRMPEMIPGFGPLSLPAPNIETRLSKEEPTDV